MALRFVTGFNVGTPGWTTGNAGNKFADAVNGSPAVVTVDSRNWLEISTAAASENLQWTADTLAASQTRIALGIRLRFQTTVPTAAIAVQIILAAGNAVILEVNASDVLRAGFEGGTMQNGPTLSADTDYYVELHLDVSGNPNVLDWQVNGSAQTQVTEGQAATTISTLSIGTTNSETWTGLFTDVVCWTDTADITFPISSHRVEVATVDTGGTWTLTGTAANWSTFTSNGTLDTSFTVTEARDRCDDWPPTIGASADGVVQDAIAASDLLSSPMTAPTLAGGETVTGLRALVVGWATSTTGTNIRFDAFNGTTAETFFALADPNFDNSTTAPAWVCKMLTTANYDTQGELDALELRGGWGTDANPDCGWHGWAVEIAIKESTGAATVTPDPVAATVALPASTLSIGVVPAVLAGVAALPQTGVGVGVTNVPVAAVAALPQPAVSIGVVPTPVAAVAALPLAGIATHVIPDPVAAVAALPQAAVGVGATAAVLASVVALPQPAVSVGVAPAVAALTIAILLPTSVGQVSSGATVTPDAIAAVASLPQPGIGVGVAPAAIQVLVDIGMGLGVDVGVTPTTPPVVVTVPLPTEVGQGSVNVTPTPVAAASAVLQAALSVGVTKDPVAAVAALPQASVGVGVAPAPVAIGESFPQAAIAVGVTPAVVASVAALLQPAVSVGVTTGPVAAVAALPQATPDGGAGTPATVTPDPVAAVAALPQTAVGVGAAPAVTALAAALPQATIVVHTFAQPAAVALVATLPQPAVSIGVVPVPVAVVIAVLAPDRVGPPFEANINPAGPVIVGIITSAIDTIVGATSRPGGMAGEIS